MRTELRHLRYFIAVAEELSFTRAAERLHIAQPPLSQQIQQLEEDIGVRLLERNRRQVRLTPQGQKFLREARKVIAQVQHALEAVQPEKEGATGIVRVGVATFLAERIAPVFARHGKRFPKVEVICQDIWSRRQNRALIEGNIDVGFLRPPVDRHLMSEHLFDDPIRVLISRKNPLSKRKALSMRDLANETLLLPERHISGGIHDKSLHLFRMADVDAKVVQTQTGPYEETGTMLVASGKGVFLVSGARSYRSFGKEVTTVPLTEADAFFEVYLAWRKGEKSPVVLNLLQTAREVFKRNGPAPRLVRRNRSL